MNYNLKKINSYELELLVTLDKNDLEYYIKEAQKYLANDLKIKGFRQGKVPTEIAKDKLDKKEVLEISFDIAFKQSFSDVLMKEKFELISADKFEVKENSAEKMLYTVLLMIFPELKLGNYKNIKIEKKSVSVSSEEIEKTVEFIKNSRKINDVVPELNDDFAKSLGNFQNLAQLKDSIGDGLRQGKEAKEKQRIQSIILDKIATDTKIEIPPILIDRQLDQMMLDLDADLHQQGMELGLFLAKIKKTSDELRNEWKPKAEGLVKKALILKEVAKNENIKVEAEEVKEKISQFVQNFGTIEEAEKNIDLAKLSDQIGQVLLNQKVLEFLEKEAK
ncbi:MAG: hypothetical protein A2913_00975 [Parcubacteria group bacterium RIFCSPLOWO2_01_FULL_40_65]|nr:MAG: hypothetical protein A2734_01830 [Parcubacteria group bacterium RIFCSPHIGHO2_01_FULL_40_30]OHB19382.1 MAG: hypothetical protein A3D40_01800 [Parcubacteria group bacterium RIFCSPHIGHO2_02_FULL_40_12]OHB21246.1 MAG: hypothetical protein A2913_00975 [Parcubacteria group bacterium RIFCSPLOWO2_01_FULL_40_65]OHB23562.1 MAG: hypothetical protein A3I22_02190 [Parcubacteria group bacterium RIFCSPLOWO2_02_FULL_40_12]OHB24312.1 MAG: hypothetical protein A3F96_00505 [Parcubacteria group bacterium R